MIGWESLARGLVVGFSIAAPVGPVGLLCVRRSLARGFSVGFASGLGAASADAIYGAIAGFGLTAVSNLLIEWKAGFELIGGAMLLRLAWTTARGVPTEHAADAGDGAGLLGAWASTFSLTLTNPATILSFAAVFGGLGLAGGDAERALSLVLGVFAGSALWWLTLSLGVGALRAKITRGWMVWINRVSGGILAVFGLGAWWSLAF